jgi:hypothetical protein
MTLNEEDQVCAWIDIQNGSSVNPQGGSLQLGQDFYWANPVANVTVTLTGCGGFCVDSSYTVPAPPQGQTYGLKKATLLSSPAPGAWSFTESPLEWNAPGVPRITNPPDTGPLEANAEVA